MEVLRGVEGAKVVRVEVRREERSEAAEEVKIARHRADTDYVRTVVVDVALARPGELKVERKYQADPARWQTDFFSLFDQGVLTTGSYRDKMGWRGKTGAFTRATVDDVLRSTSSLVWMMSPELTELLDSEGEQRFFKFGTNWKWVGAATDEERKVWRVSFVEPSEEHWRWEAWVTQGETPRLTRLIVSGNSTMGVSEVDPGKAFNGMLDASNSKSWTYKVVVRNETVFTKWEVGGAVGPEVFVRPAGDYKEKVYAENALARVGDVVAAPALLDATGAAVELGKRKGPIVMDFWFAKCAHCMVYTPKVEAVVKAFGGKVALYGIDGQDNAATIAATAEKQGWTGMRNLVDGGGRYTQAMHVEAWPTVMVIGVDGKLLYRDTPGEAGALGRLKDVLERATREVE
jgi:thiol-disulfide isomerase/thioredoxin